MFNSNKKYSYSVLIFIGALFNLLAVFREDSGALVAVGCSLIVLGIAARKRIDQGGFYLAVSGCWNRYGLLVPAQYGLKGQGVLGVAQSERQG